MSNSIESLQHDYAILMEILQTRRAVSTETMHLGERIYWHMYLTLLADTLKLLDFLIDRRKHTEGNDQNSIIGS